MSAEQGCLVAARMDVLALVSVGGWLSRFKLIRFGVLVWRRCLGMG